VTEDCTRNGLKKGNEMTVLTAPKDEFEVIATNVCCNRIYLYFVVAHGSPMGFEECGSVSESRQAESYGDLISVLGPFGTLSEARRFRWFHEDTDPTPSEPELRKLFRSYIERCGI